MRTFSANLIVSGNRVISYETHVATIEGDKLIVEPAHGVGSRNGKWSRTTAKHINQVAKELGLTKVEGKREPVTDNHKTVAMVAMLGKLFTSNQKEKNDWQARMLKAGLENHGLIMPDDWDSLSEDEKERRLEGVIKILNE